MDDRTSHKMNFKIAHVHTAQFQGLHIRTEIWISDLSAPGPIQIEPQPSATVPHESHAVIDVPAQTAEHGNEGSRAPGAELRATPPSQHHGTEGEPPASRNEGGPSLALNEGRPSVAQDEGGPSAHRNEGGPSAPRDEGGPSAPRSPTPPDQPRPPSPPRKSRRIS